MQALPALSDTELPPAVGLVLKLASESPASRAAAVHTVRRRMKAQAGVSGGTLDAVRFAVTRHADIATTVLADIDADCRSAKPALPPEVMPRFKRSSFSCFSFWCSQPAKDHAQEGRQLYIPSSCSGLMR